MVTTVLISLFTFSLGLLVGRLVKWPVGRWAFLLVVLVALIGAAYLYGTVNGLQAAKSLLRLW